MQGTTQELPEINLNILIPIVITSPTEKWVCSDEISFANDK